MDAKGSDVYDALPDGLRQALRRHNQERLAELEASTQERQARMAQVLVRATVFVQEPNDAA